jgi:pyruvate kinase
MKLEWTSKLNPDYRPAKNYRRTSIIGTIGKQAVALSVVIISIFSAPNI